MITRAETHSD